MGTDVHHIFEKRVTKEDGTVEWERIEDNWEGWRNYFLFGWLANVRNGYGFAGCDLGDCIKPLAEPRGLPEDANKNELNSECVYDYDYHGEWLGDHSHSWLTSTEILAGAPLINPVNRRGVMSLDRYHKWDKVSEPDGYSGGSWGRNLFTVDSRGPDFQRQLKHHEYALELSRNLDASKDRNQKKTRVRTVKETRRVLTGDPIGLVEEIFVIHGANRFEYAKVDVKKRVQVNTRRKSVLKHQRKLEKYLNRMGRMNVTCQWQESPDAIRHKFRELLDEVKRLHDLHGEVRMVFGFDS